MQRKHMERAMTKILLMSDLHIEFGGLTVPKTQADVAVLAGDIHVGVKAAAWSDKLAKRLGIPVVHVAGNHEHYGSLRRRGGHLGRTIGQLRAAAAATAGRVTFLERETAVVAGVRFVGCTLWTDYDLFGNPAEDMAHAEIAMTDHETIAYQPRVRFTTNDTRYEFMLARDFLKAELPQPFNGPTVVVTHHLPSLRSVPQRFKDDRLSAAYASHLDERVATSGADLWCHGHTHSSCDYVIGKTRVLCNPRGYDGIALNPSFDSRLTAEVG
jgi:predicted phosphodiesterase